MERPFPEEKQVSWLKPEGFAVANGSYSGKELVSGIQGQFWFLNKRNKYQEVHRWDV